MIWTIPSTTLKLSILNSTLTNTPFGRVVGKTCPSLRHDGTRRNLSHLAGLCSTKYPEGASCELRRDGVLRSSKLGPGPIPPETPRRGVAHPWSLVRRARSPSLGALPIRPPPLIGSREGTRARRASIAPPLPPGPAR